MLSEAGRISLATAGITTSWIAAWIRSAGAGHVEIHALNDVSWESMEGWIVVIADDVDLMRVALAHGKRISAGSDGRRTLIGSDVFSLINPERSAWFYRHGNSRVLLIPSGDIAYQRFLWIARLNDDNALVPLLVSTEANVGEMLEPALYGMVASNNLKRRTEGILNDSGWLPEEQLVMLLRKYRMRLCCAESCTAGGVAARVSRLPGASDVLERGWVTYSNEAKQDDLGVPAALIEKHGAVSRQVVEAMSKQCVKRGGKNETAAIAISGIAGPDGGSEDKPVGTVWIAVQLPGGKPLSNCCHFTGSRTDIQSAAVSTAMSMLIAAVDRS